MGVSTDGQICYGIVFEEGFEFPWDSEEFDYSLEDWFEHINGYEEPFPLIPVDKINYCSGDCPMYILAVPSSCRSNSRGYPETFLPEELKVSEKERQSLIDFCQQYILTEDNADEFPAMAPKWYLTSYWG